MQARVTINRPNYYEIWDIQIPKGKDEAWVIENLYGPECEFQRIVDSGSDFEEIDTVEIVK